MPKAQLKKLDTMDKSSRGMLHRVLKQINMESFNLKDNPVYQRGMQSLQNMMNPDSEQMQTLEQPYRRQWEEETVPGIAEQFGQYDAQNSSAFNQALSRSSSDLEQNIAGVKTNAMMNASGQALNYSQAPANMYQNLVNLGLTGPQSYGYQVIPGSKGWGAGAGGVAGQMAGTYAANKFNQGGTNAGSGTPPQTQTDSAQNNLAYRPSQQEMAGW